MATITGVNSTLAIGVLDLFAVPQALGGYGSDDAYAIGAVDIIETKLGVDGKLSAGYVPQIKVMDITLQADSASNQFFETWYVQQESQHEVFEGFGLINQPAISMSYVLANGWLKNFTPMAAFKKTLEARTFQIEWGSVTPVPL